MSNFDEANMKGTIALCALLVLTALAQGCRAGISREVVEQALSGKAGARIPGDKVRAAGEQAIPVIFDVVRGAHDDAHLYRASLLVDGMTELHTVDASAPYIRKVLADRREPESIRVLAAEMLGFYWESPEPRRALIGHIRGDPSEAVRARCISSVSCLTLTRLMRRKVWIVDQQAQQVFTVAMKDKSAQVREETCNSVAGIAGEALYEGIEFKWCRVLLLEGKHDTDRRVRAAAVDGLFVLKSIKRKTHR